ESGANNQQTTSNKVDLPKLFSPTIQIFWPCKMS
ncbi:MAG: hypothetical protein ACI82S_001469, partial [Patiriisocius sp.]